eukprot:COSAG05_NODE_681_length_7961_cov_105.324854_4_plen_48_part_00
MYVNSGYAMRAHHTQMAKALDQAKNTRLTHLPGQCHFLPPSTSTMHD